jgi:hypothetical protein
MKLPPPVKKMIGGLDGAIQGMQEAGVTGTPLEVLTSQRDMMLNGIVQQDPAVQAADRQIAQQFGAFDTDGNGQIDELDADYQRAQRIVDMIAQNPTAKTKIMQQYGGTVVAQAEALVQAVKQREKLTAQRRVELGK